MSKVKSHRLLIKEVSPKNRRQNPRNYKIILKSARTVAAEVLEKLRIENDPARKS